MHRQLRQIIQSVATSDGAGVKIRRSLGQSPAARFDPILMLDEFNSDKADDYIAGFPSHPHRGFETVTYMLDGHMLHEDHMGNRGDLKAGDVQWMTAGRGIIHSEMPQQINGRMRGFQLWINLPKAEKMKAAAYRDIPAADIPITQPAEGVSVKVIAGQLASTEGPISGLSTQPLYWDITLDNQAQVDFTVPDEHHLFLYCYEGEVAVGEDRRSLKAGQAGLLTNGEQLALSAPERSRVLLIGGRPIGEPIAQYGPFVMNSPEEIEQAINDYRSGQLTA